MCIPHTRYRKETEEVTSVTFRLAQQFYWNNHTEFIQEDILPLCNSKTVFHHFATVFQGPVDVCMCFYENTEALDGSI